MLKRRAFDETFIYDNTLGTIDACAFKASPSEIVREVVRELRLSITRVVTPVSVMSMSPRERNFLIFSVASAAFRVKQELTIEKS